MKMKNKFVIGIIAMFSMSSYVMANSEREKFCSELSRSSNLVMEARQLNVPLLDALNIIPKHAPDSLKKLLTTINIEAYKSPLFSTDENKEIAITEFGNKIYLECISN